MKYVINLFHHFTFYNTIPKIHKCAQKGTVYKLGMARYNFLKFRTLENTNTALILQLGVSANTNI